MGDDNKLVEAFIGAQLEFPPIRKNAKGQVGRTVIDYANLEEVLKVKPILLKHGIALHQSVRLEPDGWATMITRLCGHGSYFDSELPFFPERDSKLYGAQLTYMRRYAVGMTCCLVAEMDAEDIPDFGEQHMPPEQPRTSVRSGKAAASTSKAPEFPVEHWIEQITIAVDQTQLKLIASALKKYAKEYTAEETSRLRMLWAKRKNELETGTMTVKVEEE